MLVPAEAVVRLPPGCDPVQASMLRVNGLTAEALLGEAGVQAGETIVQSPGRGGVAQFVTQLAKARGVQVINLVGDGDSTETGSEASSPVVARSSLDREASLGVREHGARVAFDGSGGIATEHLARCLEDGGRVFVYGAMSRQAPQVDVADLVFRNVTVTGFWLHRWTRRQGAEAVARRLSELAMLRMECRVASRFQLADLGRALEAADETRHGRVILSMGESVG
jgi:NADPH:quinone reductase-like Zn-dependent oxidoreductase